MTAPLPDPASPDPRIAFILRLARSLHTSGYAAHRLEEALVLATTQLGLEGQFFSTPTSIMASFGPQYDQRTFMIRVEPGESDLGKLARVDEATREVLNGKRTPLDGSLRLEAIEAEPPRYGPAITTLAYGVVSAAGARFLGGGWREMLLALAIGIVTGLLATLASRVPRVGGVFELLAAFIASVLAMTAATAGFRVSVFLATLGGVIVLIPGLMLTTAMTELSTRHYVSGTARFMGAFVLLLAIAFGIAVGAKLVTLAAGGVVAVDPMPLGEWTLVPTLLLGPLGFVVLLKAEPRDAVWIVLAGILAFVGARLSARALGPELGAFGGALVAGVASNWYSRFTKRPAQITLVPGLLLLVPGSVGLTSLASLLDRNTIPGVEGAFRMVLIAVALVAGILFANVISRRRTLIS